MKLLLVALVGCTGLAAFGAGYSKPVPLADVAQHAMEQSKLTLPGSAPFHLKATISETTNPDSTYKGEIEEYWVSPEIWRRTVSSPAFSQTLIMNGGQISERNEGDYFPWWLNDFVTAMFDPLPMLDSFKTISASIRKPSGSERSTSCARLQTKVGTPAAASSAFLVFCFEGSHGLLASAVTPGYDARFEDYREFNTKRVARRIVMDPEPGTTIEAKISSLEGLANPDEALFAISQPTLPEQRLLRIRVSEGVIRGLSLSTPDVLWPAVRGGKTSGVLSVYVSIDRSGRVRETWPLNSDNAGLDDSLREQVMRWVFTPYKLNGSPVQVETILTFAFNTKIGNPIPILSDQEARELASKIVDPAFPPGTPKGTEVDIQIGVTTDGTISGVTNIRNQPTPLFMAAYAAVTQWHFRPYIHDGKPDVFGANIVFRAP